MKKYLKFAVMAAFTFIAGLTVYHAQARVQLSDAQLENVEALANNEYDEPKHCEGHYIVCRSHREQFERDLYNNCNIFVGTIEWIECEPGV